MIRWMSVLVAVCAATGCSRGTTEPVGEVSPPESVSGPASPSTFAGTWRSVTPSLEFLRLSVHATSSEPGTLTARLTFSGVAWEGGGRIEGDSLVASMAIVGATVPSGVMVARPSDARTLRVVMRPATGAATAVTFVREK